MIPPLLDFSGLDFTDCSSLDFSYLVNNVDWVSKQGDRIIIHRDVSFSGCKFDQVSFSKISFEGRVDFSQAVFNTAYFFDCVFGKSYDEDDKRMILNFSWMAVETRFTVKKTTINGNVILDGTNITVKSLFALGNRSNIGFEEVVFKGHLFVRNLRLGDNTEDGSSLVLSFSKSKFYGNTEFDELPVATSLYLEQTEIFKNFHISDSHLDSLKCLAMKLHGHMMLNFRPFVVTESTPATQRGISEVYFPHSIINGRLDIAYGIFDKLCFDFAKIANTGSVRFVSSEVTKVLKCHDVSVDGRFASSATTIQELDARDAYVPGEFNIRSIRGKSAITTITDRTTARLLKHEALKQNNRIEALDYHATEMQSYQEELKMTCEWYDADRVILWFNRITTNYGLDWARGLKFTFCTMILTYWTFLFVLKWEQDIEIVYYTSGKEFIDYLGVNIKHLLQVLNVTKWDFAPFGLTDYSWAYSILAIGRLIISLGLYQTIQAFRKYGRW